MRMNLLIQLQLLHYIIMYYNLSITFHIYLQFQRVRKFSMNDYIVVYYINLIQFTLNWIFYKFTKTFSKILKQNFFDFHLKQTKNNWCYSTFFDFLKFGFCCNNI